MNAMTLTHAKQNFEMLFERVVSDLEPAIVSHDTGESVVVMPLDQFNSWQETIYLLSNPPNARHLRESLAQAKAGNVIEKMLIEA